MVTFQHVGKIRLDPYLTLYYFDTFQIYQRLNCEKKHIQILEENVKEFLYNLGVGKTLLTNGYKRQN